MPLRLCRPTSVASLISFSDPPAEARVGRVSPPNQHTCIVTPRTGQQRPRVLFFDIKTSNIPARPVWSDLWPNTKHHHYSRLPSSPSPRNASSLPSCTILANSLDGAIEPLSGALDEQRHRLIFRSSNPTAPSSNDFRVAVQLKGEFVTAYSSWLLKPPSLPRLTGLASCLHLLSRALVFSSPTPRRMHKDMSRSYS